MMYELGTFPAANTIIGAFPNAFSIVSLEHKRCCAVGSRDHFKAAMVINRLTGNNKKELHNFFFNSHTKVQKTTIQALIHT